MVTTDGENWTLSDQMSARYQQAHWVDGINQFVCFGYAQNDGSKKYCARSDDGITWTETPWLDMCPDSTDNSMWPRFAARGLNENGDECYFVAVSSNGRIFSSTDGFNTFYQYGSGMGQTIYGCSWIHYNYDLGLWTFMSTQNSSSGVMWSDNGGANWYKADTPSIWWSGPPNTNPYSVATAGMRWIDPTPINPQGYYVISAYFQYYGVDIKMAYSLDGKTFGFCGPGNYESLGRDIDSKIYENSCSAGWANDTDPDKDIGHIPTQYQINWLNDGTRLYIPINTITQYDNRKMGVYSTTDLVNWQIDAVPESVLMKVIIVGFLELV